jgi:hypothetical protein
MSHPLGMLCFKSDDGTDVFVEVTKVVAIWTHGDPGRTLNPTTVRIDPRADFHSTEPAADIAARYDALVKCGGNMQPGYLLSVLDTIKPPFDID